MGKLLKPLRLYTHTHTHTDILLNDKKETAACYGIGVGFIFDAQKMNTKKKNQD